MQESFSAPVLLIPPQPIPEPEPDPGPPPLTVSVSSPAAGGTVSGAEPGAAFLVTGSYQAVGYTGVAISVTLDGIAYPAALNTSARTWSVTVRAYRAGADTLIAEISGSYQGDGYAHSRTVAFTAALASAVPVVNVSSPAGGSTAQLEEGGASLVVTATTSDQYGPRTLTLSWEGRGAPMVAQSATVYTATLQLAPMPLGNRQFVVTCVDRAGNTGTRAVTLIGVDKAPPRPTVSYPAAGSSIVADATQRAVFRATGTAIDTQSGMSGGSAAVSWALSLNGARTPASQVGGGYANWYADITVTGFGSQTLYFWVTDAANNSIANPLVVPITLISSYTPSTLDERLDGRQYLVALMSFARDQVSVPGTGGVSTSQLVAVLRQPLDRISQPLSAAADAGRQSINQLRVPIEVLRAHIAANGLPTAPGAAGEATYLTTAYGALLAELGTSYTQLRIARGAAQADRQELATRLGITLSAARPDELDKLLLDGPALTEAALENVFGLPATTVTLDVLRTVATSQVVNWRLAGLANTWAVQDQSPPIPRTFPALVDPDTVTAADVTPGPRGDVVRGLLTARTSALAGFAQTYDNARRSGANPAASLAALLAAALPGVDLAVLETRERAGTDISADLATAGLTRTGFLYLRQIARLAAAPNPVVTDPEWADAVAVLVGARKRTLTATWRAQESAVVLSPDQFVLGGPAPQPNPYRVDARARSDWQAVLAGRVAERQALLDGADAMVAAAERAALPVLRDALLAVVGAALPAGTDAGEQMTAWYLLDVKAGGSLRTTRLAQATESLQTLLFTIRSVSLPLLHPARGWTLPAGRTVFDAAWRWMGDLAGWRTAIQAFLFPERNLAPTLLLPNQARPMDALWNAIRGSRAFTAADAAAAAATYVAAKRSASAAFPDFTYLDPQRATPHQSQLAAFSQTVANTDPASAREAFWAVPMLIAQRLQAAGEYLAALDWYWLLYPYDTANVPSIYHVVNTELGAAPARPNLTFPPGWTANLNPFDLLAGRPAPFTRATLLAIARCHIDFADVEFTRETDVSVARARGLYVSAAQLLASTWLQPVPPVNQGEPALAVPELTALAGRALVQLSKLRQGRNIAGTPRVLETVSTDAVSQPTPYRFKVLLERAKQLTAQADKIEAAYLAALEKYDAKSFQLYDAQKALAVAGAQLDLQAAREVEASSAVLAAQAQQTRATALVKLYQDNIDAPPNRYEEALLSGYQTMRDARNVIAAADMAIGIAQAASSASNLLDEIVSFGAVGLSNAVMAAGVATKGAATMWVNNLEAQAQANQLRAGIEQRRAQWRDQQANAQQDGLVAAAQVRVALDQQTIIAREKDIAQLQDDQAAATLKLLTTQFTNADLYQWMSRTLGEVYRYFLQQATATARLAQAQLAFERAEPAQALVENDYWRSPAELASGATDRAGLTGAERLLQDLSRLDEYAFSTDRRRLNLTQTFSLAQLMPSEFLDFRRTGALVFGTPMALFDADFPGHYLRLIRQVRLSLVALVPPGRGIRASLYTNGVSRVTTQQRGGFTDIVLRHDPTVVAVTSPVNSTGLFDLDIQPEMLLPFEGSGVDTTWELSLPKASNPFDYASIADVLFTVEYTALHDYGYAGQVASRLNANRNRRSDCVFSLARDFPDQWFTLNNPDPTVGRSVTLTLRDVDFPTGIEGLVMSDLTVQLASAASVPATGITIVRAGLSKTAQTTDGVASTRRGNAPNWAPLCGATPVGTWQLTLDPVIGPLFDSGAIDDVVLIVGWTGRTPAWPT